MTAESKWSRNFNACRNCGTTRRPHRTKGYCGPCHHAIAKIENAKIWDQRHRQTLVGIYPSGLRDENRKSLGLATDSLNSKEFERFRAAYISEYQKRLSMLKSRERCWKQEPIDEISVEHQLRRLAKRIRPKQSGAFYGRASILRKRFGSNELISLAQLLDELEELFPWRLDWGSIWQETYTKRKSE